MRVLLKTLAIYVLIGPLIGLGALVLSMQVRSNFAVSPSESDVYLIPMAYLFGFLPALGTGLVTHLLLKRGAFLVVAIASGAIGAVLSSIVWLTQPDPLVTMLQLGVLPGFAAGFGSVIFARLLVRWPSNNSFKPNPLRGSA